MIDESGHQEELAIQDHVLVEAEIYGRPISFRAVIVKMCPDELWLGLLSPDHRLETMRPDQTVRLTVARPGAALLGQSGFLRPLGGSKSRVFAVVRPGALERVQRRAQVRYHIDLLITFRHLDPATREPRGKASSGTTVDMSPGGLLFHTDAQLEVGEELGVSLPLLGGDRISTLGVITRVHGSPDGTEVAVRFTRVTAVDQDRIVRFILMTEHRRREAALREPRVPVAEPVAATLPTPVPVAAAAAAAPAGPPVPARTPDPTPAPAAQPVPPSPDALSPIDPDAPLVAVGLQLCRGSEPGDVRRWFDGLMPGSRIELLSLLQANMAGTAVPGAAEPGSVRPLARALGLLAA